MGALSGALLISIIINLVLYFREAGEVVRYIDRSGILKNPPTFLETWQNKTINFKYDGVEIKIGHLPIKENLEYITKISGHFSVLKQSAETFYNRPFTKEEGSAVYIASYKAIVDLLFTLSKPHIKKSLFYKKRFYAKANQDADFVFGICQEIFDYWQNMGKLRGAMERGLSPRLMYGERLFSDRLKWDKDGERLIVPRYAYIFQALNKKRPKPPSKESTTKSKPEELKTN